MIDCGLWNPHRKMYMKKGTAPYHKFKLDSIMDKYSKKIKI